MNEGRICRGIGRWRARPDEAGGLDGGQDTAEGCLALAILPDRYPRNAFRGIRRMYDSDARAGRHRDLIARFAHRLPIPGTPLPPDETRYLTGGGFGG